MTVAASALGEVPIATQAPVGTGHKPPSKRQTIAKADAVLQPEAR